MTRRTRILAWEVLAGSRLVFGCLAATLVVATVVAMWRAPAPGRVDGIADSFLFAMVVSMTFVFAAFNHTHLDRRSGQTGFPNRLFVYPVPTRTLVAVPMLCGVLTAVSLYLAWTTLVLGPLGRDLPLLWPALVLAAAMAWYQATLWALAAFRVARLIALCVIGTTLITLAIIPDADLGKAAATSRPSSSAIMAALTVAAYAFAVFAVHRQRHAGGHGTGLRTLLERLRNLAPERSQPFRSPVHAQFWIEWQRGGLYLPAGTLLVMLFVIAAAAVAGRVDADITVLTLTTIGLTPIVLALFTGSVAGLPLVSSTDATLAPFMSTRPISCGDMVVAKLGASAVATTLAWLVVLCLTPIWLWLWCDTSTVALGWERFTAMFPGRQRWIMVALCAITVWLLTWRMAVINLFVALRGRPVLLTCCTMVGLSLGVTAVTIVCTELDSSLRDGGGTLFGASTTVAWLLNVAIVAKLVTAGLGMSNALSREWLDARTVATAALAWLAASSTVALTLYLLASRDVTLARQVPSLGFLGALCGLLLVPLARIALAVDALAHVRHR